MISEIDRFRSFEIFESLSLLDCQHNHNVQIIDCHIVVVVSDRLVQSRCQKHFGSPILADQKKLAQQTKT